MSGNGFFTVGPTIKATLPGLELHAFFWDTSQWLVLHSWDVRSTPINITVIISICLGDILEVLQALQNLLKH